MVFCVIQHSRLFVIVRSAERDNRIGFRQQFAESELALNVCRHFEICRV